MDASEGIAKRNAYIEGVIDVLDTGNQKDLKLNNKGEHKI